MSTTRLLQEWSFTQMGGGDGTKDGEWLQVSEFPTTVHVELLKLKKIPDPVSLHTFLLVHPVDALQFVGLNEWDVQCSDKGSRHRCYVG